MTSKLDLSNIMSHHAKTHDNDYSLTIHILPPQSVVKLLDYNKAKVSAIKHAILPVVITTVRDDINILLTFLFCSASKYTQDTKLMNL